MSRFEKIKLNIFKDERGALVPIELHKYVDWPVKRIYYVNHVTAPRGGHAVRDEKKIYVCQQGTIKGRLHDGEKWNDIDLDEGDAIIMKEPCFREFNEWSFGSVLLAISSVNYRPDDYIYDLDEFIKEYS
ncbi:MAG: FdtA/QdtA family cupin domain-containing protein [Patescibacteria group bacterium]|nr:FdtA/QdtA family cupin domain-containing protein [Patescibacteria group bacterium]